jgi:Uma2 family endonuclease
MERKLKEYFLAGSRLVWLVDLEIRIVSVYTSPDEVTVLREGDTLSGGDVLPGFTLPLKQLFARVPRASSKKRGRNANHKTQQGSRRKGKNGKT